MTTYTSSAAARAALIRQGDAEWLLPINGRKPIKIIANDEIFKGFDDTLIQQWVNVAEMPGAEQVIITPDSHVGFGVAVGTTVVSTDYVYPPVIGPDALCSMSFLQTDLREDALKDKATRRALINAILERIPTGLGARQAPKARKLDPSVLQRVAIFGATRERCEELGIPEAWLSHLEQKSYGHPEDLHWRLDDLDDPKHGIIPGISAKLLALGSLGAGNHFNSGDIVDVNRQSARLNVADTFGLIHGCFGSLTHCGSRGFGYQLMALHARQLKAHFELWGIPYPGGDDHLVYAPLDSVEAKEYLYDLHLAANFAIVNHLLINAYVLEAVQEVVPGTKGQLCYHVSHNVCQEEIVDGRKKWVSRKGATRAFPAGHPGLKGTAYESVGHPILLPGNARDGSVIMVADKGVEKVSCTVSHGAGRRLGRKQAKRELNQAQVDQNMLDSDVLHNGRCYPLDEAPAAYKDFDEVTRCVVQAGLATTVARLKPVFVIKDNDQSAEGAA